MLLCLGLTGTFAYHAVYGRYGLIRRQHLLERAEILDFELKSLEGAQFRLKRDVALLAPELPDADMVESVAREVLGFGDPADRITLLASDAGQ